MKPGILSDDIASEFAGLGGPVLYRDVGAEYTKNGVVYEKSTNGYSWRYKVRNGQQLPITINGTTANDSIIGTSQSFFRAFLPGGVLHEGDTVTLSFTLSGAPGSYTLGLYFTTAPTWSGHVRPFLKNSGTGNVSITFAAKDCNVLVHQSVSGMSPSSKTSGQLMNLLGDASIGCSVSWTGSTTGRNLTMSNVSWSITTANTSVIPDRSGYRLPDQQWFASTSPWNLPLPASAIRGTLSDPLAVCIRDRWFGKQTKSGATTVTLYACVQLSGNGLSDGRAHMPIYQMKDSDPWSEVVIRAGGGGGGYIRNQGAYFMYNVSSSNNAQTYKIRLPNGPLFSGQTNDRTVVCITPDKRYALEMGIYMWNADLKRHEINRLNTVDLYGYGFSNMWWPTYSNTTITDQLSTETSGFSYYYRAGGFPLMGGIVRKWELDRGLVQHVISIMTASYVCRGSRYTVVSASGNTFVVKSPNSAFPFSDYSSLFTAGVKFRDRSGGTGASTYTVVSSTYNNSTGYTTITTEEPVAASPGTQIRPGTTSKEAYDYSYVWPAVNRDAAADQGDYIGVIPMGQMFTFEAGLDLDSLGLSAESRVIAQAIKDYGAILGDIAGNTSNWCQCDQDWTNTQRTNVRNDAIKIFEKLVPVLNYDKTLVQAAIADTTNPKNPPPILPLY